MALRSAGFVASLVVGFLPLACSADGLAAIRGTASDGYTIAIDLNGTQPRVEIWKESKNQDLREKSWRNFDNEPCEYKHEIDRKGRHIISFACAKEAKSPLAGTTYLGRQVNGNCERGDPWLRYACVSGCDQNKRAPRSMTQDYWEC